VALLRRVTPACGVMLLAAGFVVAGQTSMRLESLTVPPRLLPAGCRLAPAPGGAPGQRPFVASPGVRENPWIGAGHIAAIIRQYVDGPRSSSDDLTGPERLVTLAKGVIAAYRAVYIASDGSEVDVFAVQFSDPTLTSAAAVSRLSNRPGRIIVLGATAAVVLPGRGGDCFRAVADHVASLR
jgi:hypothetical protein